MPLIHARLINTESAAPKHASALRAGPNIASGRESGNTLKFQETVYTFPDILRSPAMEPGRSTDSSLIHRLRLKITGSDTTSSQCGTCTSIRFAEEVPRRSFGGLIFSPFYICFSCCCHLLPDRSLRITSKIGCRRGRGHRSCDCSLRMETAPGQFETAD